MFEDYTEEELLEKKRECLKKYEKLEIDTIKKALTGEIGTNAKMVEALEDLNRRYLNEMDDFENYTSDLNPQIIEDFKQAEKDGENVITCAREYLELFELCEKVMSKTAYQNEDGQVCDEFGNPLNEDGEHSVFETINGEGTCNDKRGTFNNPTTLGVIKGGKQ